MGIVLASLRVLIVTGTRSMSDGVAAKKSVSTPMVHPPNAPRWSHRAGSMKVFYGQAGERLMFSASAGARPGAACGLRSSAHALRHAAP